MGPYHWLIGSVIDEGDDFCQRLRKSLVGILFFPASFVVLYGLIVGIFSPFNSWTDWADLFTLLSLVTFWWLGYYLLRKQRHVTSPQAGIIVWMMTVLLQWTMWLSPNGDRKPLAITLMLIAVLCQIPKIYLYLAFGATLTLFSDWNTAHLAEPDQMLLLPGAVWASPTEVLTFSLQVSLVLGVVIYNFIQQVAESERRGAALKAANEMTLAILGRQRKYETDAISDILKECKVAGVVEADLIALYETMNDNLKSYRPFLPNYLFQESSDEEEGEDNDDGQSEGDISAGSRSAAGSKAGGGRRSRGSSKVVVRGDSSSNDQRTASASDTRSEASRTPHMDTTLSTVNHLNKRGHLFSGRITFALVDINTDRLANAADGEDFQRSSASILKMMTHNIYSLAKETKASVHSMLGDTVQLTWNATSSVALAETKGAVFLSRLAKALKGGAPRASDKQNVDVLAAPSLPSLRLNAAVCSGNATVHSITTDHQQALIIEAPWLPSLEGCFALAKWVGTSSRDRNSSTPTSSSGCVLMDHRTMKGSNLEVQSCPVEHVRYTENGMPSFLGVYGNKSEFTYSHPIPTSASTATMVHQLLGEHVRADNEWMYQLQAGNTTDQGAEGDALSPLLKYQETLKLVVTHVLEGNFREGATVVEEIAAGGGVEGVEYLANPVFLKALAARCAKQ